MWAGAERNLLREAPQGHRRKPSATLRGSVRARAPGGHDTRFGSLEVLSRPPRCFSPVDSRGETSFSKKVPQ